MTQLNAPHPQSQIGKSPSLHLYFGRLLYVEERRE